MSRTLGLDDIPLDVFRGIVAFGMGRFAVGRLDGGMKVCGPEFEAWTSHEERQTTARDLRALVGALGFHQLRCVSRQWRTVRVRALHFRGRPRPRQRIYSVRLLL